MKMNGINTPVEMRRIKRNNILFLCLTLQVFLTACGGHIEFTPDPEDMQEYPEMATTVTEIETDTKDAGEKAAPIFVTESGIELDFVPDMSTAYAEPVAAEIPEHNCSYVNYVSIEPACTSAGERTYECTLCGRKITEAVPMTGHRYEHGVCTGCGKEVPEYKAAVEAETGIVYTHTHVYTANIVRKGNCTENGIRRYECSCGAWYEERIPAKGHNWSGGRCSVCGACEPVEANVCDVHLFVTKSNEKATCTAEGKDVIVCIYCGLERVNTFPATGHEYINGVCVNCGKNDETATVKQEHKHAYTAAVTADATCTQAGERTYKCSCGAYYTEMISAKGHNYIYGRCTACGNSDPSIKEKPVEHTHNWNGGVITRQPSCLEYGVKTYTCTVCGTTRVETIPITDHVCVNSENCMYCGTKTHSHLDANGNYAEGVWTVTHVQTKTCQQDGIDRYTCIYCGMTGTVVSQAEHEIGNDGACIWCGYTNEDQWTHYGRQLRNSGASGRSMCDSIAAYVASTGYGDCISFGSMCGLCADGAGISWEWRSVSMVNCGGIGPDSDYHDPNTFVNGFCPYCGLGDNHHWVRLYGNDGCWYEYDCFAGDSYCVRGACTPRYGTK